MPKSVLEGVQCIAGQSMGPLDNMGEQGYGGDNILVQAAVEQVRATYALATVMARIHEVLTEIERNMGVRHE